MSPPGRHVRLWQRNRDLTPKKVFISMAWEDGKLFSRNGEQFLLLVVTGLDDIRKLGNEVERLWRPWWENRGATNPAGLSKAKRTRHDR